MFWSVPRRKVPAGFGLVGGKVIVRILEHSNRQYESRFGSMGWCEGTIRPDRYMRPMGSRIVR